MALTENDITAKNFKKFFTALSPFLGSYDKGKLTFVGEVKAFFAETAPNGFLICDGATYNKADYPQLANLLLSLTDHSAYEVSGDDTKFKVPDLRGEFLRGSGTNSHANQGSGATVGTHQDATEHLRFATTSGGALITRGTSVNMANPDYTHATSAGQNVYNRSSTYTDTDYYKYTSRPTNTSVLFCIAYKDTMVDLDFLSYGGEKFAKSDMYDTNERVIGKWIDGKPLYKKTFTLNSVSAGENNLISAGVVDTLVDSKVITTLVGGHVNNIDGDVQYGDAYVRTEVWKTPSNGSVYLYVVNYNAAQSASTASAIVTVVYTKTTDTANSFKYSTPTDYSTEEKVVGTWIDGKPVYQRTLELTASDFVSEQKVNRCILSNKLNNYKEIISCNGYYKITYSTLGTLTYNLPGMGLSYNMDVFCNAVIQQDYLAIWFAEPNITSLQSVSITLQYTKTTD